MNFVLMDSGDPHWLELIQRTKHDFYHLPSYVELEAERMGGKAFAALVEEGDHFFLLPLVFRPLLVSEEPLPGAENFSDAVSPYGYPCPLVSVPNEPITAIEFLKAALSKFKTQMAKASTASVFVRLHPLFSSLPIKQFEEIGNVVHHGKTVWIDLTAGRKALWRQTRKTYRNLIRRLEKNGFKPRVDHQFHFLSRFNDIYNETMDSVDASDQYYFGLDYFKNLIKALGEKIFLCIVEDKNGIGAAGLFTECSGIVQYHLSGSARDPSYKDAAKLMLHFVSNRVLDRGNSAFHLGGGVGSASDSLLFFKSGFSKLFSDFFTWRIIINEEIYRKAEAAWSEKGGAKIKSDDAFFPIYRRSIHG